MVTERATYIGACWPLLGWADGRSSGVSRPPGRGPITTCTIPLLHRNLQLVWQLLLGDRRCLTAGDAEWPWRTAEPAGSRVPAGLGLALQPRPQHLSRQCGQRLPPALRLPGGPVPTPLLLCVLEYLHRLTPPHTPASTAVPAGLMRWPQDPAGLGEGSAPEEVGVHAGPGSRTHPPFSGPVIIISK